MSTAHNRPQKGDTTKVDPIRDRKAIARIKRNLEDNPRDFCLFVLGINTAYRANELLSITAGQVKGLAKGDLLELKQSKTQKYRRISLNGVASEAIQNLLKSRNYRDEDYLFYSARANRLTVSTVGTMVKTWCADAGLRGNYSSHSLRKTWGYWQRKGQDTPLTLLVEAYGHATQRQTLDYLGIEETEITELYEYEL